MRLDDLQHEARRDRRIEGVAAALEHGHPGLRRKPVRGRDHPEGAAELWARREHARTLVFALVVTCTRCGQENPDGAKFCNAAARPLGGRRTSPGRSGGSSPSCSSTSLGSRRAPEKLDPEDVRAFLSRTTSAFGGSSRATAGGREVHRRRGHGRLRRADRLRRRPRSGRCAPRSPSGTGPRDEEARQLRVAVNTGEAVVALEASPERRRDHRRGGRRQHRGPSSVRVAGRSRSSSARNVHRDARRDRVPTRAAGHGEGQGGFRSRRGSPVRATAGSASGRRAGRGRVGTASSSVLTGVWERVVEERRAHSSPCSVRPGSASRGRARARPVVAARGRGSSGAARRRTGPQPVQRVRAAGEAGRPDLRQRRGRRRPRKLTEAVGSLGRAAARRSTRRISRSCSASRRRKESPTASSSSSRLASRRVARAEAPDDAPLRGHPLGGREPARPARDVRVTRAGRAACSSRTRAAGVAGDAAGLGRRPPGLHGAPARSRSPTDSSQRAGGPALAGKADSAAGRHLRRDGRGQPTLHRGARRLVSPSSPTGIGELRRTSAAIIAAGSTHSRRRSALSSSTRRSWTGCSGAAPWRSFAGKGPLACSGRSRPRDLVRREAVSRIQGDQQFAFKHGLIHDVAYATLPRAARAKHAAVARFLEASRVGQSHEGSATTGGRRATTGPRDPATSRGRRPGGPRLGEERGGRPLPRGARTPPEDDVRRRRDTHAAGCGRSGREPLAPTSGLARGGTCRLGRRGR